jgi:pimeloyl-ACP methyl ester carboxylesterase
VEGLQALNNPVLIHEFTRQSVKSIVLARDTPRGSLNSAINVVGLARNTVANISRRNAIGLAAGAILSSRLSASTGPPLELQANLSRTVAVTVWRAIAQRRGVIAFSHGARSAPHKYDALIASWTAVGYDVFAPLHVDSTDHPDTAKFPGLASWPARIEDMRALARHFGDRNYVAAGHSYGALVALALGGAEAVQPEGVKGPLRDPRVQAVIAFSPPGPSPVLIERAGYAKLAVPALIQTGTNDVPPGTPAGPDAWRVHLAAFEAATPSGDRYALVLDGADHYFGNIICRPELPGPAQRMQFDQAAALSALFLRAYGLRDKKALVALDRRISESGPVTLFRK